MIKEHAVTIHKTRKKIPVSVLTCNSGNVN